MAIATVSINLSCALPNRPKGVTVEKAEPKVLAPNPSLGTITNKSPSRVSQPDEVRLSSPIVV
jgi:hypothetical protein